MALQCVTWCCCAVLFLSLLLLQPIRAEPSCDAYRGARPGVPGIPGSHGNHGNDGAKGEKGDTGDSGHALKGQDGDVGPLGPPGRPGVRGDPGSPGPQGPPGLPGAPGTSGGMAALAPGQAQPRSAFSYKRTSATPPVANMGITFNKMILEETAGGDTLTKQGQFICHTKGLYYFSFHISARTQVCLDLMKGEESVMSLCDSSENFLVASGSILTELEVDDVVTVRLGEEETVVTSTGRADNTFTGFMLFAT